MQSLRGRSQLTAKTSLERSHRTFLHANLCCSERNYLLGTFFPPDRHGKFSFPSDDYCGPFAYLWRFHAKIFHSVLDEREEKVETVRHSRRPTQLFFLRQTLLPNEKKLNKNHKKHALKKELGSAANVNRYF